MQAYFLNISEEEKKSIQEKQRSLYDGYKTMAPKIANETPLKIEDLALDKDGITVNNKGEVSEYKNKDINGVKETNEKKSDVCEQCGKEMTEEKMCECGGAGMKYTMEELEESIKVKSKKNKVNEQINESLDWFKRFNNYL